MVDVSAAFAGAVLVARKATDVTACGARDSNERRLIGKFRALVIEVVARRVSRRSSGAGFMV